MDVIVKQIRDKGKIVYEYNPLFNYRVNSELLDLITPDFNFSLKYPVDIQCQTSYDGSVNLILNDGLNKSKLINSRFRVNENNTYEVINRAGNNDANLYDKELFETDTALVKSVKRIPNIQYYGIDGAGLLPCGSYNFYFRYEDDDGNETDFIGETGSIVCHVGLINNPSSIRSGLENENSGKAINLVITDIDESYKNLKVYYSRRTSSAHNEPMVEFKKILNKYTHQNGQFNIRIDGNEQTLMSSLEEINKEFFKFDSAKTQVLCGSRLFLGNLSKNPIDYKEYKDISLRVLPYYESDDDSSVGLFNSEYVSRKNGNAYYDTFNIYNKVGYWNEEIYRLGIVYVLNDDSLSPVFNIRGKNNLPNKKDCLSSYKHFDLYNNEQRAYVDYDNYTYLILTKDLENSKGVIRIADTPGLDKIYSLGVFIPDDVINYMKNVLHIKGYFIVRQKRIANILTQAFVIGHDPYSGVPALKVDDKYIVEGFVTDRGVLNQSVRKRLKELTECDNQVAICPDYQVRLELYNNFFTNTDFTIRELKSFKVKKDPYNDRAYYVEEDSTNLSKDLKSVPIIGVPDSTPIKRTNLSLFRAKAGSAESYDFETLGGDFDIDFGSNTGNEGMVVRGAFGSYLGLSGYNGECNRLINIYIPEYSENRMSEYFKQRYLNSTPYYAITPRIPINTDPSSLLLYRGDCYICQFTHRIHRNFLDVNAPTNETIVDNQTFRNYKPKSSPTDAANINVGDLNAIKIGSWLTIKVRSNNNLSLRDYDGSRIEESLLMGNNRSFYPLTPMSDDACYKLPDSNIINTGISLQLSEKAYFELADVPYLKNTFQNRICFSDVAVVDAFKNGYRTFQSYNYEDYSNEFGGIMKLVEWQNNILVIFEHGIGLLPINERVMAGSGSGGDIVLNTNRVLPQQINMITTDYGTQWPDSVIKTEFGIYGVDTVAKKIWKFANNTITIISERKILKFLNENITFSERTLTPVIGVCNLKTHYNKFKRDVMFTFYNLLEGIEEVAWNLCFNEYTLKFTTFYSWIPSFSENIDNIFFSYDRDSSKKLSFIEYNSEGSISMQQFFEPNLSKSQSFFIKTDLPAKIKITNLKPGQCIYYTNIDELWDSESIKDNNALINGYIEANNDGLVVIEINSNCVYIKGDLTLESNTSEGVNINVYDGYNEPYEFTIGGNIRTLVDSYKSNPWGDWYKDKRNYSIPGLFKESAVVDATNLIFPDVIVYENAYKELFKDCKNLKFGPLNLPANVLFSSAYEGMFSGCEKMILGPSQLTAKFVGKDAYAKMFFNCHNLSNIIKLSSAYNPAYLVPKEITDLLSPLPEHLINSRIYMRYATETAIGHTPVLAEYPINNHEYLVAAQAYDSMFYGCSNIPYVDMYDFDSLKYLEGERFNLNFFEGNVLMLSGIVENLFKQLTGVTTKLIDFHNFNYYLVVNTPRPRYSTVEWEFCEKLYFRTDQMLSIHGNQLYITDIDLVNQLLDKYQYVPINVRATIKEQGNVYNIHERTFYLSTYDNLDKITTDFWKHGQGGIIDIKDTIKPSTWYGKVHPFEFEYVVREDLDKQKTFDSLLIMSNNVAPESFHYEIVGDSYDFSLDKLNMYVRLELTKELYLINGSDITYNRNYKSLLPEVKLRDTYTLNKLNPDISLWKQISRYKDKSTLFPTYYKRDNTIHEVYDYYAKATSPNKNYSQLSGTEITYDLGMSLFNLVNHVEAVDMKDPIQGRLRGNMLYLEDKWYVQINPINLVQKNEEWESYNAGTELNPKYQYKIPLNVCYLQLHNDIKNISTDKLPSLTNTIAYLPSDIDVSSWGKRMEVKLKDKYMKVKIRYNTDKLTLIVGVNTLYRI